VTKNGKQMGTPSLPNSNKVGTDSQEIQDTTCALDFDFAFCKTLFKET